MQTLTHTEFLAFSKPYKNVKVGIAGKIYIDVKKIVLLKTIKALQANVTFYTLVDKEMKEDIGSIFIEKIDPTLFDEEKEPKKEENV